MRNDLPIIGESAPLRNFAKKPKIVVPADIRGEMSVKIPPLYYWEDVVDGKSVLMTMAFKMFGGVYGLSYPVEDENVVRKNMARQKLFNAVRESLDVMVHHGKKVLDEGGNINPRLVNEEEAMRFKFDPWWHKKVAAFNQLCRIAPITKKKAVKLGLLNKLKINNA